MGDFRDQNWRWPLKMSASYILLAESSHLAPPAWNGIKQDTKEVDKIIAEH